MNANEAFPSNYLKAADLKGRRMVLTIESAQMDALDDGKKLVVRFRGAERALVLNRTNCTSIIEIAGTAETAAWTGTRIVLYPDRTDFQGRRVDCIRVDPPTQAAAPTPVSPPPDEELTEDDIPF